MKFPKIKHKNYKFERYYLTNEELKDFKSIQELMYSNDSESVELGIGLLKSYPAIISPKSKENLEKLLLYYSLYNNNTINFGRMYFQQALRKFVDEICEFKIYFIKYEIK